MRKFGQNHLNVLFCYDIKATHHPKDSFGPLYRVYVMNEALFGRAQGRTGDPRFQQGVDAQWRKESALRAPGPGFPLHTIDMYMCKYIYIYK